MPAVHGPLWPLITIETTDKMDAAEAKGDRPMSAGTLEPFAKVKSRLNVPTAAPGF
jgi:hypothetical protein